MFIFDVFSSQYPIVKCDLAKDLFFLIKWLSATVWWLIAVAKHCGVKVWAKKRHLETNVVPVHTIYSVSAGNQLSLDKFKHKSHSNK